MNKTLIPKKYLVLFLVVLITLVAIYLIFLKKAPDAASDESQSATLEGSEEAPDAPVVVRTTAAHRGNLNMRLKSPGEAFTRKRIIVKTEVSGRIKKLNVEEGRHVERGDLLVELDNRQYQLNLNEAKASYLQKLSELLMEQKFSLSQEQASPPSTEKLDKAKTAFDKASDLYSKGMMSMEEFEKASKEYEMILIESGELKDEIREAAKGVTQADISVKKAQMELEKTKIYAPFSGIISDIQVTSQEHVPSSHELFTLVNIDQIQVHAKVLESEIGKMETGREVTLNFSAYPEKEFKGTVKAISPVIDPEDRTCKVIVTMNNPDEVIKPGMHAEVEIITDIHQDRLLIPQDAVLVRGGRKLAFVVEGDLAKWRYLELGLENEEYTEVLDGIQEGDEVIIEGHFTLAHDARVRVVE
ncbi:MAG: efflux RND transporter periplasmic adaptor subunit [Candidatus Aminicenantes bacterium]|nr:efflux RND transporter periplasmic adaptor subunit [Candidatus Aminicenantes bacterium]